MSEKLRVGILGATGMVGQRFISLLVQEVQEKLMKKQLADVGKWILQCRKL